MQLLVEQAQASELKAKEEMWKAVRQFEELGERHRRETTSLEGMVERLNFNFKEAIIKKEQELQRFKVILELEQRVKEEVL